MNMVAYRRNRSPTARQAFVLSTVREMTAAVGYPPTTREIARRVDVSHQTVVEHLVALERKGAIRRDEGTARGIVILTT